MNMHAIAYSLNESIFLVQLFAPLHRICLAVAASFFPQYMDGRGTLTFETSSRAVESLAVYCGGMNLCDSLWQHLHFLSDD